MATTRANLITGPARIERNSKTCHTTGDVEVREVIDLFAINVDGYGTIDQRATDATVTVRFTPDGRLTTATGSDTVSLLFPYLNPSIGSDIFSSSDVPLTIHDSNSHLHTVVASACTQQPQITLSASGVTLGAAEFLGIRGTGQDWVTADKLYTQASTGGTFNDTTFKVADIRTQVYSGVWSGITGFSSAFYTVDGWTIDSEIGIQRIQTDEVGTAKAILTSVQYMVKCRPLGVTYANITAALKSQGTGAARGRSLQAAGADLTITGADGTTIIVLKSANLREGGFKFGSTQVRQGELAWMGTRTFSAGVPQALMTITTTDS
jgi:hypothetical protein